MHVVNVRYLLGRRRGTINRQPLGQQFLPLGKVQLVENLLRPLQGEARNPGDAALATASATARRNAAGCSRTDALRLIGP